MRNNVVRPFSLKVAGHIDITLTGPSRISNKGENEYVFTDSHCALLFLAASAPALAQSWFWKAGSILILAFRQMLRITITSLFCWYAAIHQG